MFEISHSFASSSQNHHEIAVVFMSKINGQKWDTYILIDCFVGQICTIWVQFRRYATNQVSAKTLVIVRKIQRCVHPEASGCNRFSHNCAWFKSEIISKIAVVVISKSRGKTAGYIRPDVVETGPISISFSYKKIISKSLGLREQRQEEITEIRTS